MSAASSELTIAARRAEASARVGAVVAIERDGPQSFHRRRFRWRGAIGTALLVPAAGMSLFSEPLTRADSAIHAALFACAWTTFVAGAALRFWATAYVGGRKERELVVDGPYALCRHPLYLGSLLLGLSAGLFLESPAVVLAVAAGAVVYVRTTIAVEETVLAARHGNRHAEYVHAVPRLIPHGLVVRPPAVVAVDVHRLWLESLRASRWMWLPLAGVVFAYVRGLPWWPRLFSWLA